MREVILGVEGGMVALDVRVDGELGLFVFLGGGGRRGVVERIRGAVREVLFDMGFRYRYSVVDMDGLQCSGNVSWWIGFGNC